MNLGPLDKKVLGSNPCKKIFFFHVWKIATFVLLCVVCHTKHKTVLLIVLTTKSPFKLKVKIKGQIWKKVMAHCGRIQIFVQKFNLKNYQLKNLNFRAKNMRLTIENIWIFAPKLQKILIWIHEQQLNFATVCLLNKFSFEDFTSRL